MTKQDQTPKATSNDEMGRFMVREKASKPRRVYLRDPATGNKTDFWIDVRSSLSDEFMETRDRVMQEAGEYIPNEEERREAIRNRQLELKASLVAGWSFSKPATKENVIAFIREAPQIGQMLLSVADDSAGFFGEPSKSSSNGRELK